MYSNLYEQGYYEDEQVIIPATSSEIPFNKDLEHLTKVNFIEF